MTITKNKLIIIGAVTFVALGTGVVFAIKYHKAHKASKPLKK